MGDRRHAIRVFPGKKRPHRRLSGARPRRRHGASDADRQEEATPVMTVYVAGYLALLTLRDDEPGRIAWRNCWPKRPGERCAVLDASSPAWNCFTGVWKDEGETEGRLAYEQSASLPITWLSANEDMLLHAAAIQGRHTISVADVWIAACAEMLDATLVP